MIITIINYCYCRVASIAIIFNPRCVCFFFFFFFFLLLLLLLQQTHSYPEFIEFTLILAAIESLPYLFVVLIQQVADKKRRFKLITISLKKIVGVFFLASIPVYKTVGNEWVGWYNHERKSTFKALTISFHPLVRKKKDTRIDVT